MLVTIVENSIPTYIRDTQRLAPGHLYWVNPGKAKLCGVIPVPKYVKIS